MDRPDTWTAKWASDKLIAHDKIVAARVCGPNHIALSVKGIGRDVQIATLSTGVVRYADLHRLSEGYDIEFAMNIQKDVVIEGRALRFAQENAFGVGGIADLYVAANDTEFRDYLPKETCFILLGLRQHSAVTNVVRENNRMYRVQRISGSDVLILALNEYDVTAETVRNGVDRFGVCDVILTSNPNAGVSQESLAAADSIGIRILAWGDLLGALNY